MERAAIFPGSFDPITIGHESLVLRALPLFDKITIAIGNNSAKHSFFSLEARIEMIGKVFANQPKVEVTSYSGLTVDLCKNLNVNYILRGLRTAADFEFERVAADVNKAMSNNIETVFMLTLPQHSSISSSIIRDILLHGSDPSQFIPKSININSYLNR